ncbi:conserved Plasmodium protein, unknown function [Plasmodium knowlesi strain H]|uniref:Clathrin light chain n=3 Tax=Plasmodium knowlesi TaxID=5850 RepID=A0A5K1U2K3_PLAKH|nr:clathrin light chain, putative [Plasmodium knowlesi strain H]OTN66659.1 Clathrin light chain [Plasmodium knowlesi]CAA9986859.1 clathrin light chain, putative [Plasmodium knowlesi strain H]SBO23706.1 conserved Plasmodium protein, unknown function [Plasmodium knowlesi strain H]SBO25343.1 conserved Plasmodium protein, unknown function [Plasmodium knowlesi strain H]VVS76333.1 clathrin light chain, putative [Plasmodium knowlesi strain H]|eukprot:XP_002260657.1 hypothetical protein, conserved in Plasmodium species [Plasmodium knowlesi strain H]
MSDLNDFDQFNFNEYDGSKGSPMEEKNMAVPSGGYGMSEELGLSNELNDSLMENGPNYDHMNMSLNSIYSDQNVTKREVEETGSSSNKYNFGEPQNDSSNKFTTSYKKESQISFENTYEQFYEKESDISDTEESTTWESERLKRIEERKEYEKNKKIEIKKKAAEDLKKWYEEMAILIEEKKKLSKKKKNEEKKKEENLENKTWLKVFQYLDIEKGEYFKENSRMKQVLLKLMKSEGS